MQLTRDKICSLIKTLGHGKLEALESPPPKKVTKVLADAGRCNQSWFHFLDDLILT